MHPNQGQRTALGEQTMLAGCLRFLQVHEVLACMIGVASVGCAVGTWGIGIISYCPTAVEASISTTVADFMPSLRHARRSVVTEQPNGQVRQLVIRKVLRLSLAVV